MLFVVVVVLKQKKTNKHFCAALSIIDIFTNFSVSATSLLNLTSQNRIYLISSFRGTYFYILLIERLYLSKAKISMGITSKSNFLYYF
jgi:hypothetical protein